MPAAPDADGKHWQTGNYHAIVSKEKRLEEFANENNIWRSAHMAVEEAGAADVMVDR
ncbi:MAG: hypothetical protein ACLFNS_05840 [Desulfobacterales bacterium]